MKTSANAIVTITISLLMFLPVESTRAGITPENLPSMDNLSALLADTSKKDVQQEIRKNKGRITSNLPIKNDSLRGTTAKEIANLLSGGDQNQEIQMKKAIMADREAFEQLLMKHGFDTKDMGVAFAVSFITLWELASYKELPLEGSLGAGKFLVYTMKEIKPSYDALPIEEREQGYDWLMTTPVAFASLIKGFEKAGRNQEAEQLRKKSAALFKKLFRMPHDTIIITAQGEISVDTDRLLENGATHDSGSTDILIDQALKAGSDDQ